MGTKAIWKGQNLSFFDPQINSGYPAGLWADCPKLAAIFDPSIGHGYREDFNNVDAATLAGYTLTDIGSSSPTFTLCGTAGGVALLDAVETTQHKGGQVQKLGLCITPAAGKDIWFETRIKVADTITKVQLFAGLAAVDTSLLANGAVSHGNGIGIASLTTLAGVAELTASKAAAEGTVAGIKTLVEDTFFNFGFKVNGVTSIEYFIDGVKGASTLLTANIPIVALTPSFVCQSDGTNDPILHIDFWEYFQLR